MIQLEIIEPFKSFTEILAKLQKKEQLMEVA